MEIVAHKIQSPDMSFKVMNRLLSVILWLIIRETTSSFPAGEPLKKNCKNTQLFTIMAQKTVLAEIIWQLRICSNT